MGRPPDCNRPPLSVVIPFGSFVGHWADGHSPRAVGTCTPRQRGGCAGASAASQGAELVEAGAGYRWWVGLRESPRGPPWLMPRYRWVPPHTPLIGALTAVTKTRAGDEGSCRVTERGRTPGGGRDGLWKGGESGFAFHSHLWRLGCSGFSCWPRSPLGRAFHVGLSARAPQL